MGFRIIDRKKVVGATGSGSPVSHRALLEEESRRLFGAKDERHLRYRSSFVDKAEEMRNLTDPDRALDDLAHHAEHLIKNAASSSPHSQLPVDISTLLDLL